MLKKVAIVVCAVFCVGLFSCKQTTAPKDEVTNVSRLKINNGDYSPWTVQTSDVYTPSAWRATSFDGGVDIYSTQQGINFTEVLVETMQGPSSELLTIFAIDYTNSANAAIMFNFKKNSEWASYTDTLPPYSDTVAIGNSSYVDGIYACAHFKQYYIELRLTGYSSYSQAKIDAINLLGIFETKINGI